jgi:hypothetical protein
MSVFVSTVVLGLAWFAVVNLAVSVLCWTAGRSIPDRVAVNGRRSSRLLALRFLPVVSAIVASGVLFAPAHLRLEPANADERIGFIVIAMACAGGCLLFGSAWRATAMAFRSRHIAAIAARNETTAASGVVMADLPLLGGIALAGVLRPRVLIGERARQVLTAEELDVAIAHEVAHRHAGDNLTRALMACAPDFLGLTRTGRRIEGVWESEAECLADLQAVAGNADRAQHLASALVKVSRLVGGREISSPAWSLLHRPALLEVRVRLLLGALGRETASRSRLLASLAVCVAVTVIAAWAVGVPGELHHLTELALARFP